MASTTKVKVENCISKLKSQRTISTFFIIILGINCTKYVKSTVSCVIEQLLARRLRANFWPDCAIPDTSMKFGTVVDHD